MIHCYPAYISEDTGIEELLQLFVAVVDTKLLETVDLVIFWGGAEQCK